jgi:hypothetical protein
MPIGPHNLTLLLYTCGERGHLKRRVSKKRHMWTTPPNSLFGFNAHVSTFKLVTKTPFVETYIDIYIYMAKVGGFILFFVA